MRVYVQNKNKQSATEGVLLKEGAGWSTLGINVLQHDRQVCKPHTSSTNNGLALAFVILLAVGGIVDLRQDLSLPALRLVMNAPPEEAEAGLCVQ